MKKIIKNIGSVVSVLLMIMPIVIIGYNEKFGSYWWILLILSICYDYYISTLLTFDNKMEKNKNFFYNVLNGKVLESNTEQKKLLWFKIICINILSDYFNEDFNNK